MFQLKFWSCKLEITVENDRDCNKYQEMLGNETGSSFRVELQDGCCINNTVLTVNETFHLTPRSFSYCQVSKTNVSVFLRLYVENQYKD